MRHLLIASAVVFATAVTLAGCGGDSSDELAAGQPAGSGASNGRATPATAGPGAQPVGGGARPGGPATGGPGGPGGGAGRGPGTITLNASDVATIRRSTLEEGLPITGNLEPIERIQVRSRLEGDLEAVYVREGQRVTRGQVLARFESSEEESVRASARADVEAANSDLANAQWNLEQSTELFKQGAIAERDVKSAQQTAAAARARVAAAQSRLRSASQGLGDTRVLAPADGVIEKRLTSTGEHVGRGAALFTLVRSGVLELAAAVPARFANSLAPGQMARFSADGHQLEGRVARVSPTVDPASRSIAVYVQVPNANGLIKGGTFTTGRIVARTLTNAIVVPSAGVRQRPDSGQPFTYVVVGQEIEQRDVTLGALDEARGLAEVKTGLKEGDRVIVGNVGLLGKGMRVQILGRDARGTGTAPRS
jgi:membrane fusion protein (multidrug efflux system)